MPKQIPIIELSKHEHIWLKEVYQRSFKAEPYDVRDLWSKLHSKVPKYFRPESMDSRLLTSDGENIRIHGVIAIQKNYAIFKKVDKTIFAIRDYILANTKTEHVDLTIMSKQLNISLAEITFNLKIVSQYISLYNGASMEQGSTHFKLIRVDGGLNIFYNYREYPGIEKVVQSKGEEKIRKDEYFNHEEILLLNDRIDGIEEDLNSLMLGQEVIWTDFKDEISDLKAMYSLPKKTWRQIFLGKLTEMIFSGIISEAVSKRIVDHLMPQITMLLLG